MEKMKRRDGEGTNLRLKNKRTDKQRNKNPHWFVYVFKLGSQVV